MREVKLTKNQVAFVDDEDFELVSKYNWQACPSGDQFKAVSKSGHDRTIFMHRLIMNCPDGFVVDHINHNQLDNQKANLRICLQSENGRNRRKSFNTKTSRFKGVYWDKLTGLWRVHIRFKGKTMEVGSFVNEEIAALSYNYAAKMCFGKFAEVNTGISEDLVKLMEAQLHALH